MTHITPVLVQEDFTIGVDQVGTGTETGHALGTLNTDVVLTDLDDYLYLRIVVKERDGGSLNNQSFRVEFRKNGGTWTALNTGTTAANIRSDQTEFSGITDQNSTTLRTGSGTIATPNNGIYNNATWTDTTASMDFIASDEFDVLVPLRLIQSANETTSGDAVPAPDDYFEFSVWDISGAARLALDTSAAYPKVTYEPDVLF